MLAIRLARVSDAIILPIPTCLWDVNADYHISIAGKSISKSLVASGIIGSVNMTVSRPAQRGDALTSHLCVKCAIWGNQGLFTLEVLLQPGL